MRPAVYAAGLEVTAGRHVIVGPTEFTVGAGHWVNVIGPNGAGKSTLLRALAGLAAFRGRLDIDGVPLARLDVRARSRHIGFVPQQANLPDAMTVAHYVLLGRSPHLGAFGSESERDFDAVDAALGQLDLHKFADRRLATLSGGERQRATIARALAQQPRLLLLDEPTSALDVGHAQEVLELIDRLRDELSLTVVSTMHDLTLAAQYGDHLVLLAGGRIAAEGPPVQVLTDTQLARHYGAAVDVIDHRGQPVVVPVREAATSTAERPYPRPRTGGADA
ncbi:MAG: ABC transporter ATP-binding protein [Desertimonas sp.]